MVSVSGRVTFVVPRRPLMSAAWTANALGSIRMTVVLGRPPLYRRPGEIGRRALGSLLEVGIKAYGAAAVVSVALSDAETVAGKSYDGLNAVPNLTQRYHEARYVVEHREQIQSALDYVHDNAPDPNELETAARQSSETLQGITTTYSEVTQAWHDVASIRPHNVMENLPSAKEHFDKAWAAKPDLDSIGQLADKAQDITPFLRHVNDLDVDFPKIYGNLLTVLDNFASDEIGATVGVMGAAFGVAYALGSAAGFWSRRGRPGLVAGTLQRVGARCFQRWYVRNLEYALGQSFYAIARERIQCDILADPQRALDPEAFHELERYFEARGMHARRAPSGLSQSRV